MKDKVFDCIIIGGGPAGLSAALYCARGGVEAAIIDSSAMGGTPVNYCEIENYLGFSKIQGYELCEKFEEHVDNFNIQKFPYEEIQKIDLVSSIKKITTLNGEFLAHSVIIATGAAENMVTFPGWTLPGVIGAGAAQTMMNLHGIQPGKKILMLGSGNVGLVVSFQLLQAGCEVVALVDAAPRIGGYGVHASKVSRCGVPFYLSHTITKAHGEDHVTGVTISEVDEKFTPVPGTEKTFEVDTICMAVGLSPMSQLLKMAGCEMEDNPKRGGQVPIIDEYGETTVSGVFAAGDVSGIEEASSAMIEGRMAGVCVCDYLGYIDSEEKEAELKKLEADLDSLRQGMFAPKNRGKLVEKTDEGIDISMNLLKKGYVSDEEIERFPGVVHKKGVHPVIECTQNIPCNPCQDACPKGCISTGDNITYLPFFKEDSECINCGMCVASCSGQAIFLVDEDCGDGTATVTLPYEFLPLPEVGDKGYGLSRSGEKVCEAEVISVKSLKAFDHTNLLTMRIPKEYAMKARFYKSIL